LKLVYILVDLDESLLNGVEGIIFVLDDAHGHGKRPSMILIEQRPKSPGISCLYAGLLGFGRIGQRLIHPRSSTFSRG